MSGYSLGSEPRFLQACDVKGAHRASRAAFLIYCEN